MLIPKDSKDLPAFKNWLTAVREQACSTSTVFTGPLKTAVDNLVKDIDAWISKLPTEEVACKNWNLDDQLSSLFNLVTQCSAYAQLAALELSKATNGASTQNATAVTAEIERRITAGELYTKDGMAAHVKAQLDGGQLFEKARLDQLCSEAKIAGINEGKATAEQAVALAAATEKLIGERKAELQAASLPLPEADIERIVLGGTAEDYAARKKAFEDRRTALATEGIQLNSDSALAQLWLDQSAYAGFERTVKSLPQLKMVPNPAAKLPGSGDTKQAAPLVV